MTKEKIIQSGSSEGSGNRGLMNEIKKRYVNLTQAAYYLDSSAQTAQKFCEQINAKRKMGRRCLYDLQVIDQYFEDQAAACEQQPE